MVTVSGGSASASVSLAQNSEAVRGYRPMNSLGTHSGAVKTMAAVSSVLSEAAEGMDASARGGEEARRSSKPASFIWPVVVCLPPLHLHRIFRTENLLGPMPKTGKGPYNRELAVGAPASIPTIIHLLHSFDRPTHKQGLASGSWSTGVCFSPRICLNGIRGPSHTPEPGRLAVWACLVHVNAASILGLSVSVMLVPVAMLNARQIHRGQEERELIAQGERLASFVSFRKCRPESGFETPDGISGQIKSESCGVAVRGTVLS
jgi:hypothetical protein